MICRNHNQLLLTSRAKRRFAQKCEARFGSRICNYKLMSDRVISDRTKPPTLTAAEMVGRIQSTCRTSRQSTKYAGNRRATAKRQQWIAETSIGLLTTVMAPRILLFYYNHCSCVSSISASCGNGQGFGARRRVRKALGDEELEHLKHIRK
jgi:hypothetical protein